MEKTGIKLRKIWNIRQASKQQMYRRMRIDSMDKGSASCQVAEVPWIKCPMKYIGRLCPTSCCPTEDEHLASIPYLEHRSWKVWKVCPAAQMKEFEDLWIDHIYNMNCWKDFNKVVSRQMFYKKRIRFNPWSRQKYEALLSFCMIIQHWRTFFHCRPEACLDESIPLSP